MGGLIFYVIASAVLLFVGAYWVYTLEKRFQALEARYQKILALADDADEATIAQLLARFEDQETRLGQAEATVAQLHQALTHTIQGYGVVRYNAFENVGGEQSFSLALVDEEGNGALLTGLHARADTRVYAKSLAQWRSTYSLSAEEQQVLGKARQVLEQGPQPLDEELTNG